MAARMACDGRVCVSERRSIISPQSNEPFTSRPDDHAMPLLVPAFIQHVIQQKAGPLAYIPTRASLGWRYSSYTWNATTKQLTVRIHDQHYKLSNTNHTIAITAEYFGGTLATCGDGNEKSYQVDGNKVWSSADNLAWRCVKGAQGRIVKILASGGKYPAVGLAIIAASVKRI